MRIVAIGCEYTGKTILFQGLMAWGHDRGIHHHLDDHFSIPDCQMLKSKEDQETMRSLPQILKERYQRFQLAYHVRLINKYEHILLGGFHIEEYIYGPRYYYPDIGRIAETPRAWEVSRPTPFSSTSRPARMSSKSGWKRPRTTIPSSRKGTSRRSSRSSSRNSAPPGLSVNSKSTPPT